METMTSIDYWTLGGIFVAAFLVIGCFWWALWLALDEMQEWDKRKNR